MRSQEVFRQNLKVLMAKSGLKVKDLADMVGLSPSYLSLILSGERQNLKDFHKDAIALALGTTVSSLYTPDSSQPAAFTARPSPVPGRDRDISAFEELTRVMNVGDDALLSALYRELNSLSDDEVHRFGQVIRAALISWQESAARRAADASAAPSGLRDRGVTEPEGVPSPGARLTAEQRSFLGLVARLSSIFGDVPVAMLEIATGWHSPRVYNMLDCAESIGAVYPVRDEGGRVALRPARLFDLETARSWIASSFKEECFGRLGESLAPSLDYVLEGGRTGDVKVEEALPFKVRIDQVAEVFLEARDYLAARKWYERAAVGAFDQDAWRVAKQYLVIVSSLDGILRTPAEERVRAYQMLATACLNLGEIDEALIYQERNIAFWERAGSKSDLTMALLRAGSMFGKKRDLPRAKEYLERALKVSSGDLVAESQARLGLAAILGSTGSLNAAKEELELVLSIGGKLNESGIMVQSLLGLGRVFVARGDTRRALQYLNRALSLAERRESVAEIWLKIELGRLRFQEGSIESARSELEAAMDRAKAVRNSEQEHTAAAHLARCLAATGDPSISVRAPERGFDLAVQAERFFSSSGAGYGRVVALVACAECSAALQSATQAFEYFGEAAREARESGDPALEAFACEAFAKHLESIGDEMAGVMLQRARWARARIR
ncbi:MAG: helix-turn-helix domain-containing protein [Bacillota bacterium]|jgi:tetratricopeptide (TPR) repeat protein/transcriptional regulator with XRE-family HTH domain